MDANALIDQLRAAIDAEELRTDWPHRPSCQMLRPVPPGLPFDTLTCNCDAASKWLAILDGHRQLLGWCEDAIERGEPLPDGVNEGRDQDEIERDEAIASKAEQVTAILAKTHDITEPA